MEDHRIASVMRVMCQWVDRCTGCGEDCHSRTISPDYVLAILEAIEEADSAAGFYRVPFEPTHEQMIAGLRCALQGESPRITYQRMIMATSLPKPS